MFGILIPTAIDTIIALGAILAFTLSLGYWENGADCALRFNVSPSLCVPRLFYHAERVLHIDRKKSNTDFYRDAVTPKLLPSPLKTDDWSSRLKVHVVIRLGSPLLILAFFVTLVVTVPLSFITYLFSLILRHKYIRHKYISKLIPHKYISNLNLILIDYNSTVSLFLPIAFFALVEPKNVARRCKIGGFLI